MELFPDAIDGSAEYRAILDIEFFAYGARASRAFRALPCAQSI
jgi:hypothetical protein